MIELDRCCCYCVHWLLLIVLLNGLVFSAWVFLAVIRCSQMEYQILLFRNKPIKNVLFDLSVLKSKGYVEPIFKLNSFDHDRSTKYTFFINFKCKCRQ